MKAQKLACSGTASALLAVILCTLSSSAVWGEVTPTNIWIDLCSLDSTYLGQPVPAGAQIAVFDPQGVRCGEFIVEEGEEGIYGYMPCYGDDLITTPEEDEGAVPGDVLRFTINGATAQTETVSLNGNIVPAATEVIWDQPGSLWHVNLHARLDVSQHTLESSINPANLSQSVTFTATVTGNGPGGEIPTGNVQFSIDGAPLAAATLDQYARAAISTADLAAGTYTITAAYEGDTIFYPSTAGLTQEVRPYEERCGLATGAYDFNASGPVHVEIGELGSLACLRVQHAADSHPQALPGIATGQYWIIEGSNDLGEPAGDFSLTLTLPVSFVPDNQDRLCRYVGTGQIWDCAADSFDAGNRTVTRASVDRLGDWAVGNDVNPNFVRLRHLHANAQGSKIVWTVLALSLIGMLATGFFQINYRAEPRQRRGDTEIP